MFGKNDQCFLQQPAKQERRGENRWAMQTLRAKEGEKEGRGFKKGMAST